MRPQTPVHTSAENEIIQMLQTTKKRTDFQRVQCVWLRIKFGMDAESVAQITNLKSGTIRKIWSQYLQSGAQILLTKQRGGRKNCYLSIEEEKLLVEPYLKEDRQEHPNIVTEIKAAYEQAVEKPVSKSTIYRLLARHGWRKKQAPAKKERKSSLKNIEISEYWINGCAKSITSRKQRDISQQWLEETLQKMSNQHQEDT